MTERNTLNSFMERVLGAARESGEQTLEDDAIGIGVQLSIISNYLADLETGKIDLTYRSIHTKKELERARSKGIFHALDIISESFRKKE